MVAEGVYDGYVYYYYYDGVRPLSDQDRAEIAATAEDEERVRNRIGATALVREPGFTAAERNLMRPTFDINGM